MKYREIAKAIRDPENQPHQFSDADLAQFFVEAADEIERLREALAAVKECIEDKSYIDAEMIIDTALKGDE